MDALIESRLSEVEGICRRLGVQRLELFGSAARDDFDPQRSDIDLLVTLEPMAPARYAAVFFDLKTGLEALFQRPVDLLTDASLQNPYRRARIASERLPLYGS
jgi:predicted nucleotidyltransferase